MYVILLSVTTIIKYEDYREFSSVKESQLKIWKMLSPDKYNEWVNYRNDYKRVEYILIISLLMFIWSGIPNMADNLRNPKRLTNKRFFYLERKIHEYFKNKFKQ